MACKGGLYIPLDDHVEAYCTTPAFRECPHSHHADQIEIFTQPTRVMNSQRKYIRYISKNKVALAKVSGNSDIVSRWPSGGTTLDLSMGGMRLETKEPFMNDTLLRFSFDESFPEDLQSGLGLVKWCNKHIDEPGYQVGIAFKEKNILKAMKRYLDRHNPPLR